MTPPRSTQRRRLIAYRHSKIVDLATGLAWHPDTSAPRRTSRYRNRESRERWAEQNMLDIANREQGSLLGTLPSDPRDPHGRIPRIEVLA